MLHITIIANYKDMLLNSARTDQFRFDLPVDILPEDIAKQYNDIFVNQPTQLISDINDLLYDSVQSIDIMSMNAPIVKQSVANLVDDKTGIKRTVDQFFRGSKTVHQTVDKRINITFRMSAGFINYFALLESYIRYHDDKTTHDFYQPMRFVSLYNDQPMFAIDFSNCIFAAIDKQHFDLTNTDTSEQTFTTTWVFNNFDFRLPSEIKAQ